MNPPADGPPLHETRGAHEADSDGRAENLRLVIDAVPVPIAYVDAERRYRFNNAAYEHWFGLSRTELVGRHVADALGADTYRVLEPFVSRALAGETVRFERRLRFHGAGTRDIVVSYVPHHVGDRVEGYVALIEDVTDREATRSRLQASEDRFAAVLENATLGVFLMDEHQHCIYMNPAAERLTGYTLAETLGRPLHDVVHHTRPDGSHYPLSECPIDQAFPEENQAQGEEVFVHRDGTFYPVAFTASPVRDADGRPVGTVIEVRDIREEKAAAESLKAGQQRLERVFDHAAMGLVVASPDGRIQRANAALRRMLDYTEAELRALTLLDITHPDDRADATVRLGELLAGRTPSFVLEKRCRAKGGADVWVRSSVTLVPPSAAGPSEVVAVLEDITERKRAEMARDASEQRLRLATEYAGVATWDTDLATGRTLWSPTHYQVFGYEPRADGEATFEMWRSGVHPEDRPAVLHALEVARSDPDGRYHAEYRVRPADGGPVRWLSSHGRLLFDSRGVAARAVGVFVDVTDRKQHELELARSREQLGQQLAQLDSIYATAPVGLCVLDRELRFVRVNERLAEINGLSASEHLGRTMREVVPVIADAVEPALRRLLETGEPVLDFEVEGQTPARPGVTRHWVESWFPIRDGSGRVVGINIVADEVTEQREAAAALRASEERFRVAQESSLVAFSILETVRDDAGRIVDFAMTYVNPAAAELMRRSRDELMGRRILDLMPSHREQGLFDRYVRVVETGEGHNVEVPYEADGIHGAFQNVCSKFGDGVAVWYMDVSERRRATEEIARQREELQTMLDLMPVGVAIAHDTRADHITTTPRFAELLGMNPDQNASLTGPGRERLPYRCVRDGIEIPASELPMQRAVRTGQDVRGEEFDVELADGRIVNLMVSAAPLFDTAGHVRGAIGAHVNVTPLKQVQRELEAGDRQKDEFLAMLAHELRNPLAPIRNAGEILTRTLPGDSPAASVVGIIRRQVAHLTRLVDDLLDVSRITRGRVELDRRVVEVAEIVAQALETVEPLMTEKRHRLTLAPGDRQFFVDGDVARLVQCLVNLLTNAAKYTDPGGEVRVAVGESGGRVSVEVSDNGAGIAASLLPHVFDLFVQSDRTLDRSQGGLGIGLSVVRRLVEMHGGEVRAQSAGLGRGATFTVYLPRVAPPAAGVTAERGGIVAPRRVLVVDDNVDAANSLSMVLRLEGHETEAVYSGPEALAMLEGFAPDVVLLDIGLPEMNGYEVARRLRQRSTAGRPRLVALTGYGQAEDRARALKAGFDDHLVKPVDFDALKRSLA